MSDTENNIKTLYQCKKCLNILEDKFYPKNDTDKVICSDCQIEPFIDDISKLLGQLKDIDISEEHIEYIFNELLFNSLN